MGRLQFITTARGYHGFRSFHFKKYSSTKTGEKRKIENSNLTLQVSIGDVFLHTKKIGYRLTKGYPIRTMLKIITQVQSETLKSKHYKM